MILDTGMCSLHSIFKSCSPTQWDLDENFKVVEMFVQQVRLVKQVSERAVKLVQDFANSITKYISTYETSIHKYIKNISR